MWWRLVLYVSFVPACLTLLECSLACLPTYLLDNLTIILFMMVVKSLKALLILFFKTALLFSIYTDPLYRYHFPVSCCSTVITYCVITCWAFTWRAFTWHANTYCAVTTWHIPPVCYYLTPTCITWHMYDITCLLSPDTCHAWYLTLIIITIREWWPDILIISWYIPVQIVLLMHLYSWYSWHVTAHSHNLIII